MKYINKKLRRSVFLKAAKMIHRASLDCPRGIHTTSPYCCDCLWDVTSSMKTSGYEQEFFCEMFGREQSAYRLGWWDTGDRNYTGHDYESRILALLLCYEMIESDRNEKA